jgi:PAS domain-containing protein
MDGDGDVDEGPTESAGEDAALDPLLVAPAAVLEGLPDAVVAAAPDGRIVFVNAVAEELFGYPRRELLGQPVQTLWRCTSPRSTRCGSRSPRGGCVETARSSSGR